MLEKFKNLFRKEAPEYKRDVSVFANYIEITSKYLAKRRGISVEQAKEFIVTNLRAGGRFEFKDRTVDYFDREDNGDRVKKRGKLSNYISETVRKGRIIAPTFTVYLNPKKEKESLLAQYVDTNIKLRGVAKKAYFAAKAALNKLVEAVKKIEQTGRKLANNALSGAHLSASTPLYNKTAHPTLTSTCRTTSGYGNANNEKFLSGNRHYWSFTTTMNNIATIVTNVDYEKIKKAMDAFNLTYPTHEQTMQVITRSTSLYWTDAVYLAKIEKYVRTLTPIERAAYCYVGDMWHLMQFNQEFMREFLTKLSTRVTGVHPDPADSIKRAPEAYVNFAHQLCKEETKGIGKDYKLIEGKPAYHTLALTVDNIDAVLRDHYDIIQAFWMTDNVPHGVSHFPASIRRTALASDTDSTIFTVQDWVIWYSGRPGFDKQSMGIYYSAVFLTSATITHVLATMSANLGVVEEKMFRIEMKSEFSFDIFTPTQQGKHYYAAISCQEGNVFDELEYEIKGVQLKNAAVPRTLIKAGEKMMQDIIATVMAEKKISLNEYLVRVAKIELGIINGIRNGDLTYLRNSSIKDAGSYAGEKEKSPYQNHFFWEEVFAPKYGAMQPPPYGTKKISLTTDTPTKLKAWIDVIEDREFANRLESYLNKNAKKTLTTVNLPTDMIVNAGIPKEIEMVIDYDKLVLDLCGNFYIILETLGYYSVGEKVKRLVSKVVPPEAIEA